MSVRVKNVSHTTFLFNDVSLQFYFVLSQSMILISYFGRFLSLIYLSIYNINDLIFFPVLLGHHCTQPLHAKLGAAGSIRASLYFYNNKEDVDFFIIKLKETIEMFRSMPSFE